MYTSTYFYKKIYVKLKDILYINIYYFFKFNFVFFKYIHIYLNLFCIKNI